MIRWPFWFVILYMVLVLGIDTLATQHVKFIIDWDLFNWWSADIAAKLSPWVAAIGLPDASIAWLRTPLAQRVEVFDMIFWLIVPFIACLRGMDWKAFGFGRLGKWDYALLLLIGIGGMAVMFIIPHIPELQSTYPTRAHLSSEQKWDYVISKTVWNLSWLLGWEFLHRYLLLRSAIAKSFRHGWLLVPLSEGLYHLQKPLLECFGMVFFSIVLTRWAMARGSVLAPALAHFLIEVDLMVFRLLV